MSNPYDAAPWKESQIKLKPHYTFEAQNLEEAKRWQRNLRRRFRNRLGGFPPDDSPLNARTLSSANLDGYTREEIRFSSRNGLYVFGYFLLPKEATTPLPTLLCLHGHGPGVNPIVGLDAQGKLLAEPEYQNSFALQAVQRGYAVLAIEILGFGRRREAPYPSSPDASSCQTLSGTALMTGQTMAGWRVYDAMRAIDYLHTRPEVDRKRFGTMGISGGGLNALYLSALDMRVRATVVSGFLNTFRDSMLGVPHCIDNFVPGLLLDAEMSDIAGLIAPRALWCENGSDDPIFPVKAFRRALRDVRKIYDAFGDMSLCNGEVFEGDHCFHGVGAWAFLEKHL
jgi:dienelactone hydrolase